MVHFPGILQFTCNFKHTQNVEKTLVNEIVNTSQNEYQFVILILYIITVQCSCWDCCHICFSRCKKAYWTEVWWHCCTVRHEALAIHCYKWQHTPQSSSWIQRGDQGLLPRGDFFHGAYKDEGNCRGIPGKSRFLSNTLPSYSPYWKQREHNFMQTPVFAIMVLRMLLWWV